MKKILLALGLLSMATSAFSMAQVKPVPQHAKPPAETMRVTIDASVKNGSEQVFNLHDERVVSLQSCQGNENHAPIKSIGLRGDEKTALCKDVPTYPADESVVIHSPYEDQDLFATINGKRVPLIHDRTKSSIVINTQTPESSNTVKNKKIIDGVEYIFELSYSASLIK